VSGERKLKCCRYWNCNGKGIAIVAVITEDIDWAAYIGSDNGESQESCTEYTARVGEKLSEEDARFFFPDITLPYRD